MPFCTTKKERRWWRLVWGKKSLLWEGFCWGGACSQKNGGMPNKSQKRWSAPGSGSRKWMAEERVVRLKGVKIFAKNPRALWTTMQGPQASAWVPQLSRDGKFVKVGCKVLFRVFSMKFVSLKPFVTMLFLQKTLTSYGIKNRFQEIRCFW